VTAAGGQGAAHLLFLLATIFLATKFLGGVAQRLGQPSVVGELVAGVLLGGSLLGVLDPHEPVIAAMAEIGVVVLLFETGIHTDLKGLLEVGGVAATVAVAGVLLPMAGGYYAGIAFGLAPTAALVAGAAMCATSVGISARVLSDLKCLDTSEGRVVLGAAVIDDIIGLIILSLIAALVGGQAWSLAGIGKTTGVAVGFIVLAVVVGGLIAPPVFRFVERVKTGGTLGISLLAFAFLWAFFADAAGSALIVGAFAAGLVLDDTPARREISRATTTIGHFFVPIFFASVGASVDLRALGSGRALGFGAALVAIGVVGKIAAGYVPFWFRGNKLLVGTAMVPRGEVGLIFAQMGLTSQAISRGEFGAIMLMVLATTLVTPPALARVVRRGASESDDPPLPVDRVGDGGIDDLVSGTSAAEASRPTPRATQAVKRQ
jgi:Kef-type K+ transport system membrane component KefB